MQGITTTPSGTIMVTGPAAIALFRAKTIESALRLYAKTGMKANRAYTPAAMMDAAQSITGRTFKRRDYIGAADALRQWCDLQSALSDARGLDFVHSPMCYLSTSGGLWRVIYQAAPLSVDRPTAAEALKALDAYRPAPVPHPLIQWNGDKSDWEPRS